MSRLRCAGGQATSEYVALVALVAIALALASGLTAGGVGGGVLAGLRQGLCRVADVRCPRPHAPRDALDPCPVERREEDEQVAATIAVVRLGRGGTLSLVRGSDGGATVTLAEGRDAGLEASAGARLRLGSHALGGHLTAAVGVAWAAGRSWSFPDVEAARRFVDRYGRKATIGGQVLDDVRGACSLLCDAIGWRPHAALPEPDEVYSEAGAAGRLTAAFGSARGSIGGGALLGRRAARDGSVTWYVKLDAAASAGLALPHLALDAGASGGAVLGYELDAAGRPLALRVRVTAAVSAEATAELPGVTAGEGAGAVAELEAALDLRDPANRAAAAGLLAALADPAALASVPARARVLGTRLAADARIDRRTYVVRRSASGAGAGAGLGVKLDGGFDRTATVLRLAGAETRLPGLPFLPRDDCRPA